MPAWLSGFQALTSDQQGILAAVTAIAVAVLGAWTLGHFLGMRLEKWVASRASSLAGGFAGRLCRLTRYATATVLLAAFAGIAPMIAAPGRILLVGALGAALALLVYQFARGLRISPLLAGMLSLGIGVTVVAGRLGGLDPLIAGLDRAAVSFGKTRLSLLDILNFGITAGLLFGAVRATIRLVNRSIGNVTAFDLSQRVLFQKLSQIGVVTLAFFIGIDLLGIDLTALAVFSGALGLAVGFGLQKTFGNLIAGLILLMDRSIKPGDVIVVGDTFGWVNKIGVRYVSVLTRDGKEHLIPNEKLMTEPVENWSYSNKNVRLHIKVAIAHGCDVHLAQRLMIEAAQDHPRILPDPEPVCWIIGFGLSAVEHELRLWIDDPEAGIHNVQGEVLLAIWDRFKANGIVLPYQQHDVHIRSMPERASS